MSAIRAPSEASSILEYVDRLRPSAHLELLPGSSGNHLERGIHLHDRGGEFGLQVHVLQLNGRSDQVLRGRRAE